MPKPCPANTVIDQETGVCLPSGSIRAIAEGMEIPLLADETLGCSEGARLVLGGSHAACVPVESTCGPGARWEKKGCVPDRPDARVVQGGIVDVAAWVRAYLGPDGGFGSSFLCGDFARSPWTLTAGTDVRFVLGMSVELRIPNNDLTEAVARLEAFDATTGQPIPGEILQARVDRLISGLRGLGGTARASAVSTRIRCALPIGGRPMATPLMR